MANRPQAPTPVLAEKAPEPGEKPPEPTIKIAGLNSLDKTVKTELKEVGDTVVEEYKPTADELAKLALAPSVPLATPVPPEQPQVDTAERLTLIPPSVAARTMAEMDRGRQIVEQKTKLRAQLLGQ